MSSGSSGFELKRLRPFAHRFRASDLRHRAMLQEQLLTPDGYGGNSQQWDDISEFWIDIRPLSAFEIAQAAKLETVVDTLIIMRDPGDLTLKLSATSRVSRVLRFVYGAHYYKIKGIIEHGEWLQVVCAEIQPTD